MNRVAVTTNPTSAVPAEASADSSAGASAPVDASTPLTPPPLVAGDALDAPRASGRRSGRGRRTGGGLRFAKWLVVGAALLLFVLPILYMVLMSFKSPDDILSRSILPTQLVWQNWSEALGETPVLTTFQP